MLQKNEKNMNTNADNFPPEHMTPGEALTEARLAKNLTEVDVAKQLLLSKQIIIALENDDYSKIVAPVYAKGYLKAYAHLLGLSPEAILSSFERLNFYKDAQVFSDPAIKQSIENERAPVRRVSKVFPIRWAYYGIFALIILILVIVVTTHQFTTKDAAEDPAAKDGAVSLDVPAKETAKNNTAITLKSVDISKTSKEEPVEQNVALPGQNAEAGANDSKSETAALQDKAEEEAKLKAHKGRNRESE